jgi:uncharacterized GH25 family protein
VRAFNAARPLAYQFNLFGIQRWSIATSMHCSGNVDACFKKGTVMAIFKRLFAGLLSAGWIFFAGLSQPASAHEFWLMPSTFEAPADTRLDLRLLVGQFFEGDEVPLSREYVSSMLDFSTQGKKDLLARVPPTSRAGMALTFATAGSHLIAIDTHPNSVKLSADQFNYYLRDEGLDTILALRERTNTTRTPSRERYRRHIKTLITVAGKADDTVLMRTGQRLEIVPITDPQRRHAGDTLAFQLMFDGQPLANALIKAWHKADRQTMLIRTRSDADGMTRLMLPSAGTWMLSVVHMLPVKNDPAFDWESFWGNLSFRLDSAGEQSTN